MSKPWYYTIGYPVKVLHDGAWKSGIICDGYRYEDGIISVMTAVGKVVWFGEAQKGECLKPNLPDDNPWIPVSERLPEENQRVWITKEYHGGNRRVDTSVFRNNEFEVTGFKGVVCTDLVRAWLPRFVPEPYQEES